MLFLCEIVPCVYSPFYFNQFDFVIVSLPSYWKFGKGIIPSEIKLASLLVYHIGRQGGGQIFTVMGQQFVKRQYVPPYFGGKIRRLFG